MSSAVVGMSYLDAEHLARIVSIQNEIAITPLNLPDLMQLIAERTQELTGADGAAFELLEGEEMVYRAASGTTAPFVGLRLNVHSSLSGRCVLTREVLVCDDSESDPRVDREACRKVGVRSMIVVPLPQSDRLVGVLKVLSAHPHAFQIRDRWTLELMAVLLGGMANHAAQAEAQAEALRQSEERYRTIVENTGEGIWMVDAQLRTTFVNPRLAQMLDYPEEEMCGLSPEQFFFEEDREQVDKRFAARRSGHKDLLDVRLRRRDGSAAWFLASATPMMGNHNEFLGSLALLTNITERRHMEEQLLQAQKLESVGRLAGGIAHDFNNLLTAILGYGELAQEETNENPYVNECLGNMIEAANRASRLTGQLLAFARKQVIEPKIVNLNDLILGLDKMLRRLIGENIELLLLPSENLNFVRVDPGQFEQIVANLVINARDAMSRGGKITVETHNAILDDEYCRSNEGVLPGDYVVLIVSDTGTGMDAAVKLHIFEPFFTTKEQGRGTGLGLATVYGIVKQAGGHIWLYSEPGVGTTFKIYLPRTSETPVTTETMSALPNALDGAETLLLVEDEAAVRELTAQTLKRYGYTVLEAANGEEALQLVKGREADVALLVTDIVMPKVDGRELAVRLQKENPALKILYTSGYTENAILHHGILEPGIAFLAKPFTLTQLMRKIREVFDKPE